MASLGRSSALLLLCRSAGYLLALLNSVVLARGLGVNGLGVYAYAIGIAGFFGLVPNLGINPVITRTVAQQPEISGNILRIGIRAQALLSVFTFLCISGLAWLLPNQPVPLLYVNLAAAQMVLGTLSWPYLAVLAGHMRYDRVALVELLSVISGSAFLLAVIVMGGGITAALIAHLLAAGTSVAMVRQATLPFLAIEHYSDLSLRRLIGQAIPFGILSVAQSFYTRVDVIVLGQMASTYSLGLYNVAYKPVNMLTSLGNTLASPIFPLMAQVRTPGTPEAVTWVMRGLLAIGPGIAIASTGLASPIIRSLYGSEYASAGPIFSVLAWSAVANWLYGPASMILQARNHERCWTMWIAVGLVLNTAVNLLLIPSWGGLGAALATLISEAVLLLAGTILMWRRMGIRPDAQPLLACFGSTAASLGTLWGLWGWGSVPATSVAFAVYWVVAFLLRLVTPGDARRAAQGIRAILFGTSQG
jgi:O-antigen/teichoic acid export membrane protein